MEAVVHSIEYKDSRTLETEITFLIACDKVARNELINIRLVNKEKVQSYKNAITRILKAAKRDGFIQLFVFENDINDAQRTDAIYLINKFPYLSCLEAVDASSIYVKL